MDTEAKKDLGQFILDSAKVKNPGDLALVIIEKDAKAPTPAMLEKMDANLSYFSLEDEASEYSLAEATIKAQKNGKRLVMDIKKDLSPASLNFFKKIIEIGTVSSVAGNVDFIPGTVITIVNREFAQKNISYDGFYGLFTSAFSIEK
ncbi:MAG: hypothetical protein EXS48_02670 [Candidatus Staskawiczbacteria bacterium]|nr:hypothetical protein [Candidatus Staskawiczbacteria bacterium]